MKKSKINKILIMLISFIFLVLVITNNVYATETGDETQSIIKPKKVTGLTHTRFSDYSIVNLSWDSVISDKVEVYMYNDSINDFKFYQETAGCDRDDLKISLTLHNLKPSTLYRAKVRAYNIVNGEKVYGDFSDEIKFMTNPEKVSNFKATLVSNGIKLTWNKHKNATKFKIYIKDSKDGYYYDVYVVDGNKNTYTDKNIRSGKRYYYSIVAASEYGNEQYESDFSNAVSEYYLEAPSVSIRSYDNKATLSWKKVSSATGYQIYRATSKDGKYTKIKTITKAKTTSYTDKKIKSKKLYYYKVRTYKKSGKNNYYSVYSSIKEKARYSQVQVTKATYNTGKKSNTIKWSKLSGITGYQIYRATSKNGKYTKIKTITNAKTTSYTDKKNIGVGNLYYYKIRSYKKERKKDILWTIFIT